MCKQETTGSCRGCPAIEVAAAVVRRDQKNPDDLIERIALLCPDERQPQSEILYEETQLQMSTQALNQPCEITPETVQ